MLPQLGLVIGILLLIAAGFIAITAIKEYCRTRRNQTAGNFSIDCNGDCGSHFEFILKLENGRIREALVKGSRCAHSLICAQAAADLAKGKTIAEINNITANDIAQKAGGLSAEHKHCALLAAQGLAQAVKALENRQTDSA